MQESCTYGSVRGAPSNGRPYRNREAAGILVISVSFAPTFPRAGSQASDMSRRRKLGRVTRDRWFESGSLQRRVEQPHRRRLELENGLLLRRKRARSRVSEPSFRRWRELDSNHQFPMTGCGPCHGHHARFECESDQPQRYGHLRYGFVVQCPMEVGSAGAGRVGSKPEVSIPRRLPAVCSNYRHHSYTSRGERRHGSAFLLLRLDPLEPLHRAGLGHGLNRLWLAALRGGRRLLFAEFVDLLGS